MNTSWIKHVRYQAIEKFNQTGFPSTKLEDWRYTDVSVLAKKDFPFAEQKEENFSLEKIADAKLQNCYWLVLIDGYFNSQLSELPCSFVVCSLNEAIETHNDVLKFSLNQPMSQPHGFIDSNMANFTDGAFIYLERNQVLEKPLQILHFATQEATITTRHVIVLDANAQATVIETFVSEENNTYLTNSIIEAFVGANADLTLYKIQQESEQAYHFGGTYVEQAQNARFTHHNFALGSLLARSEVHCDLVTAAECELNGLYLGHDQQHLDNHTRVNHIESHGVSREFYKGILNHRSRGVFQGKIIVEKKAQHIDSQMNNRNLLLSNDAEVDTKPQLEIYADDVKCSHGVTVGQLDEKSIFYLQSRGIDEVTAKHILTFAFANEMVEKVAFEPLKEKLAADLAKKFPIVD